jgi:hypothetical protein
MQKNNVFFIEKKLGKYSWCGLIPELIFFYVNLEIFKI